jgi:FKBP-type peptidyl-prolyl cis-trans isomerase
MAYGAEGSASIGPNEALQFKVELHDIINPEPATEEKK